MLGLHIWHMAYADWSFCYLTYNVFSFSGIWFILYLVSMTYTHLTYDIHTYDIHTYDIHTYDIHTSDIHTYDIHTSDI
jgi:hypothetical protein